MNLDDPRVIVALVVAVFFSLHGLAEFNPVRRVLWSVFEWLIPRPPGKSCHSAKTMRESVHG